jgi:hypothetical protein
MSIFKYPKATMQVIPRTPNPKRKVLYKQDGRYGLVIFYYIDNVENLFMSNGPSFIRINRDDISAVRKAFRRFTSTARPTDFKKPGKQFTDYNEPDKIGVDHRSLWSKDAEQ